MSRSTLAVALVVVAATACTTGPAPTTTTTAPATTTSTTGTTTTTSTTGTTTPAPTTTTPPASTTTTAATTTTVTYPTDASLTGRTWDVVLVTAGDVLNVRRGPGVANPVVTTLAPTATGLQATGRHQDAGGSRWIELKAGTTTGWVNSFYLTRHYEGTDVYGVGVDMTEALVRLTDAIQVASDISGPVSRRGLFVVYFDQRLRRWTPTELETLMKDPTELTWSSTGCEMCVSQRWADAVGFSLVTTLNAALGAGFDTPDLGPGAPPPDQVIPTPFRNFHYLSIKDPGDPASGGLGWRTWFVFYDLSGDPGSLAADIVGLSPQAWGP